MAKATGIEIEFQAGPASVTMRGLETGPLPVPLIMKTRYLSLVLISFAAFAADQAPPPATPAPPPAAPVKRSAADLEKLVAPIALYPDPLIATILPASVYPLEIVQAARFVADTNNLAKLDQQPWDANVKAVARVPEVIKKMNDDLPWTMELGEAFLAQDKDVMDAMQSMRAKAQQVGTLKTTPQQIVTVTNVIVEKTIEQQVVVVTNTIVQIQPTSSTVVYVPTYNPAVVYYPPPPVYVGPPPVVTFAAGVAVGAIIANNCDWHHGGCYHSDVNIDIDRNVNVDRNSNVNRNSSANSTRSTAASTSGQKKWQPDQGRLSKSGTPTASASAASPQARGYGSGGGGPSAQASAASRGSPSTGGAGARPSTGAASASGPSPSASASRPSPSPSASAPKAGPSAKGTASPGSAFGGASSEAKASEASSRGASSRSGGGGGGRSAGRR
jgi:hypothetical protein